MTLRQLVGARFGDGLGWGSTLITVVPLYSLVDNIQGHDMFLQSRYLIAACKMSWIDLRTCALVSRSQCPRGLRRSSAAARLLRLWVRILLRAWMSVCRECGVLWGRGLCDGLITRPEESYRLWCVVMCDLETSWMRRPWPTGGL